MRRKITFFLMLFVFVVYGNTYAALIIDEDFSSKSNGATYGAISNFKDDFDSSIPVVGGKIESVGGNNMVNIQGVSPAYDAKSAIQINTAGYILDYIKFDFFMQYDSSTQGLLEMPTSFKAELYLLDGGKRITPEDNGIITLFSYNYENDSNYSLSNMATYTADVHSLNNEFTDSMLLVFSMNYPDWQDNYDSKAYVDNIEVGAHTVPEPSLWSILVIGFFFLKRLIKK